MSALNRISMAIAGLFGTGAAATPLANRNLFVDGAFDQWTTPGGAALGTTLAYTAATMWMSSAGTGGAGSVQAYALPLTTITSRFDTSPQYAAIFTQSTASTGTPSAYTAPTIAQRIEGVKTAAGRSVTLSAKLWVSSGSVTIPSVQCRQNFGTGGSPSASVTADKAVNWVLTTTPQRFSVRLDVPSIQGMTIGTNGNDFFIVGLWLPSGVTFSIGIAEMQLEYCSPRASSDLTGNGGLATCFEYRGYGPELARVQRYYYAQVGSHTLTAVSPFVGYGQYFNWSWPVMMRATPAVTPTWGGANGVSGEAVNNVNSTGCDFTVTTNLGANSNFYVALSALIADARL